MTSSKKDLPWTLFVTALCTCPNCLTRTTGLTLATQGILNFKHVQLQRLRFLKLTNIIYLAFLWTDLPIFWSDIHCFWGHGNQSEVETGMANCSPLSPGKFSKFKWFCTIICLCFWHECRPLGRPQVLSYSLVLLVHWPCWAHSSSGPSMQPKISVCLRHTLKARIVIIWFWVSLFLILYKTTIYLFIYFKKP